MAGEIEPHIDREAEVEQLFEDWKEALELPRSFPQPIPNELPSGNEILSTVGYRREELHSHNDTKHLNYKLVQDALVVMHYYSGYSFVISQDGQGTSTTARALDSLEAFSVISSKQIPVLIGEDFLLAAGEESSEELKARVMRELLKRAVVSQQEVLKTVKHPPNEDFPYGYSEPERVRRYDFQEKGVIDEQYNVDLDRALEELGGIEGIFSGLSDYFQGFAVRIDFSSKLSKKDPIKYGLYAARLFNAANDVLQELIDKGMIARRGKGALLQGIGSRQALDIISETLDVDMKVIDRHRTLNTFSAWRMLLSSYPDYASKIGTYVNSGLMGQIFAGEEELTIDEVFGRFEENLKKTLQSDPNSLHLGFK